MNERPSRQKADEPSSSSHNSPSMRSTVVGVFGWIEVVEPIIESARSPRCLARPLDFIAITPTHADASLAVVGGHLLISDWCRRCLAFLWEFGLSRETACAHTVVTGRVRPGVRVWSGA